MRYMMPQMDSDVVLFMANGDNLGNSREYYLNRATEVIMQCFDYYQGKAVRDSLDWIVPTTRAIINYLESMPEHDRVKVFSKYSKGHITFKGTLPITEYKFRQWEMITRADVLHARIRRDGMSIREIEEALGYRKTAIRGRNSVDGRRRVSNQKAKIDELTAQLQVRHDKYSLIK